MGRKANPRNNRLALGGAAATRKHSAAGFRIAHPTLVRRAGSLHRRFLLPFLAGFAGAAGALRSATTAGRSASSSTMKQA